MLVISQKKYSCELSRSFRNEFHYLGASANLTETYMKYSIVISLMSLSMLAYGQSRNAIKKSWIKVSADNLSGTTTAPDTLYTRYTFEKDVVYVSLEPAWDNYILNWQFNDGGIRIGFQDYIIKELTDSSFTLEAPGFRKTRLLAEEYLISRSELPIVIDTLNGKPLYLANKMITARYQRGKSLDMELEKNSHGYNIRQLSKFRIEFVVDEKGIVLNIKVTDGITIGFDKAMTDAIAKTSKKWKAAVYNGKPIQTLMSFERKYINTSQMGTLNNE